MSSLLDLRRIRVGIEISGRVQYYEGLRVKASGTKYANATQNECTLTISGLKRETRNYLLSETSPYNDNRTPKRIILEVGRVSAGIFQLFIGDIISAEPSLPPDLDITLKAKTQNFQAGNIVAVSHGPLSKLSVIAKNIAASLGLILNFQATDKQIANFQHSGPALKQVDALANAGGVRAYIDDKRLIVKNLDAALSGRIRILNKNSGMVGIPKVTEKGVDVTFLIDSEATLGGLLRLESQINPAVNGDYVINQLGFEVASHDTPFFYTAKTTRL